MSEQIWHQYLEKKEAKEYNEYNEYLSDFEEDLNEISSQEETNSYKWDSLMIDTASFILPFLLVCLGLSFLTFTIFQFSEQLRTIPFGLLFKSTFLAYFIFPIKDLVACIWFLFIKKNFQMEDIREFHNTLNPSLQILWKHPNEDNLINFILEDFNLQFILFIILVAFFIRFNTKHRLSPIVAYLSLSITIGFILYESLAMYILL